MSMRVDRQAPDVPVDQVAQVPAWCAPLVEDARRMPGLLERAARAASRASTRASTAMRPPSGGARTLIATACSNRPSLRLAFAGPSLMPPRPISSSKPVAADLKRRRLGGRPGLDAQQAAGVTGAQQVLHCARSAALAAQRRASQAFTPGRGPCPARGIEEASERCALHTSAESNLGRRSAAQPNRTSSGRRTTPDRRAAPRCGRPSVTSPTT